MSETTTAAEPLTIRMHERDNVAIVANDGGLPAGAQLPSGLVLCDRVPQGHKLALVGINAGAPVLRYGIPIGYALNWPARAPLPVARLDLAQISTLTFRAPDMARYPALRLCREVMATRGLAGAAFNSAKEVALDHFLGGGIGFMDMAGVVETTLARLSSDMRLHSDVLTLDDILGADHLARIRASEAALALSARRA